MQDWASARTSAPTQSYKNIKVCTFSSDLCHKLAEVFVFFVSWFNYFINSKNFQIMAI